MINNTNGYREEHMAFVRLRVGNNSDAGNGHTRSPTDNERGYVRSFSNVKNSKSCVCTKAATLTDLLCASKYESLDAQSSKFQNEN